MPYIPRYNDIPVYTQSSPGTLTIEQAFQQCIAVGFDSSPAVIAVAIMMAESGLRSDASNTSGNNPPSTDRGIVQINSYYHPEVTDACAYNTECAIKEMLRISSGGSDFTAWATYTGGQYRRHLAEIQNAIGVVGAVGDRKEGTTPSYPRSLSALFGTSDGRIYGSDDSGRNWQLYHNFQDGLPIKVIRTSPTIPGIWAFGGDTGDPTTLVRVDINRDSNFISVPFTGSLRSLLSALGSGYFVNSAAFNNLGLVISFSGGIDPAIWVNDDPLGEGEWTAVTGADGEPVNAVAPGNDAEFVGAGPNHSLNSTDSSAVSLFDPPPSEIHHIVWEGLEGAYLAAAEDHFLKSVDLAASWASLRPNTDLGTTWPSGALGRQTSMTVGPRNIAGNPDTDPTGGGGIWPVPPAGAWTGASAYNGGALTPNRWYLLLTHNENAPMPMLTGTDITVQEVGGLFTPNVQDGLGTKTVDAKIFLVYAGASPSLDPTPFAVAGIRLNNTGDAKFAHIKASNLIAENYERTATADPILLTSASPTGHVNDITVIIESGPIDGSHTPADDTPAATSLTAGRYFYLGAHSSFSQHFTSNALTTVPDVADFLIFFVLQMSFN